MFKKVIVASGLLALSGFSLALEVSPPPYSNMVGKRLSSVECLAVNAYHESRGESDVANIMVMSTVINRVNSIRYPDDICKVIFQYKAYSWTSDNLSDKVIDKWSYNRLYRLAEKFIMNKYTLLHISQGADHYHTTDSSPYWSKDSNMKHVTTIDNHHFYKYK